MRAMFRFFLTFVSKKCSKKNAVHFQGLGHLAACLFLSTLETL